MTQVAQQEAPVRAPAAALPVLACRCGAWTLSDGAVIFPLPVVESRRRAVLERLLAAALLAAALPGLLLAGLIIRLEDGGPMLFAQERFGRGGRLFRLYKLRTMRPEAEGLQCGLQTGAAAGRPFKLAVDPRATRIGLWLRRHGLDELPQLLNVIRGEMRLVGPRPLPAYEERLYGESWQRGRLEGTPGLTGLWQVSGRHAMTFAEMCVVDIWYLRHRSPRLDLRILLRTVGVVAGGRA